MNQLLNLKYVKKYIIIILLLLFLFELLNHPDLVINNALYSSNLWFNNIFPTLLPFFTISTLLINYDFVEIISPIFYPLFHKLFKVSKESTFIILMSLFTGIPGSAKYIVDMDKNGYINSKEGTRLLCFTFFSNPLFILGALSTNMLSNKNIGYLILFCHYLPNIIIGIYMRKYYNINNTNNNKRISNTNFGKLITNSLLSSINTLLLILGIITLSSLLITIINNSFDINKTFLASILEITQGLNLISKSSFAFETKVILSTTILSFGGFSSHMQILSIISDTEIQYKPFFISRIFHSIMSSILAFIILKIY